MARKVNACGVACRTVAELKDKWGLLKRATTQKKNDAKKTGGGKGMPPPPYEDAVMAILGDNSCLVNGIEVTGTESFPAMEMEEGDLKTSQSIVVGKDWPTASRHKPAAAIVMLEVCDDVLVLDNSGLGVEGNAIASGEDWTTLPTASRPQPPPAAVTLEFCDDAMVVNNSGLGVGGKEPSLPDAASTPQSLSRWKNLRKQRTKRRFQQTAAAADELQDEFLKNQVEDSKRRQKKMDFEIMILESTVNLQSLAEREKELDVKRKENLQSLAEREKELDVKRKENLQSLAEREKELDVKRKENLQSLAEREKELDVKRKVNLQSLAEREKELDVKRKENLQSLAEREKELDVKRKENLLSLAEREKELDVKRKENLQSLAEREKELGVKRKENLQSLAEREKELDVKRKELKLRKTELEVKLLDAKVANELDATSTMHGD